MKTNRIQLLIALVLTTAASAKDPKPPGGHRPPPPPLLAVLDNNRNGELNEDEIANASIALLTLDKSGDGQLTRMELMPPPPKKKSSTPPPPPRPDMRPPLLIAVLDLDKNGILSAAEIETASDSLLTLDKNEDGVISQKELHPGKPPAKDPA